MNSFLRLTKHVVNTRYISFIDIEPNKYKINMQTNTGSGYWIFGGGSYRTHEAQIEVCKERDKVDYEIVTNWLKRVE
jgi:hypothetical protein